MLVLHRSPHVPVSHRAHHCCEIAGAGEYPSSINRAGHNARRDPQTIESGREPPSLTLRSAVAVDNAASIGCDVDAANPMGITRDHVTRVVPIMVAVVDLRPGVASICRGVVAANTADFPGQENGRVGGSAYRCSEPDSISQRDAAQFDETR